MNGTPDFGEMIPDKIETYNVMGVPEVPVPEIPPWKL
jgi:hypothetical protein